MENNVWVFVCTHGRFGEELMKSAEMIAGEAENVFAFSLMPDMQVISGLNLAMYIEVTSQKGNYAVDELKSIGLATLRESGKDVVKLLNER